MLSGYRLMWMAVMFDLPVMSPAERKAATDFRLALLDLGFDMNQFSVYMRFCTSQGQIDTYLSRATQGENPTLVAQELLDFLFEQQMTTKLPPVDLAGAQELMRTISDEAFEILNTLQFQDITRQKVEKVVLLLKQFKTGLNRLLTIFHIEAPDGQQPQEEIFEKRAVATQEKIFETTLQADGKKESVDDIIAQFKKTQG